MKKILALALLFVLVAASGAPGAATIINSFNTGEMSPLLQGRTDITKYYSGCQILENCVVLSHGGTQRRPGSRFIAAAKDSATAVRLVPFEFSSEQAYIIEFGNIYSRFYRDGGQILDGASIVEIVTPYLTADLFQLQFVQSADTMYIVHPTYAPRTLTRTSHVDWTLATIDFTRGPFKDQNITTTTITPSGTTGSITLTASAALFNVNHAPNTDTVGAHWQITHTVDSVTESDSFVISGSAQNSDSVTLQLGRKFDFSTHGTWTGTIKLQRSFDSEVTWKDVRIVHYENDGNITFSDTETVDDAVYRVRVEANAITAGTCNTALTARSFDVDGVVEVTAFTSSTVVTATVEHTLGDTIAVTTWAEGAWSEDEGYPGAISFFEERLVFAGSLGLPQTLWFSQTADWTNMLIGANDSDAMIYTIAADQVNVIRWLAPQNSLLIGTIGAEWQISASSDDDPLTPTNVSARRQGSYGSEALQPILLNNVVLFWQRHGRKLRELTYSFEQDSWVAPDLTILSEHITESGITQSAYQKTPDPTLWSTRTDGEIAALTYLREQDVVGWHRHTTDGDIESVAVIPGTTESEVWWSVEREIDGSTLRYIEQLQPREWGVQRDAFFVDSGLSFDGGAPVTITGITQANPGVVTAAAHGLSNGEQCRITDVVGMTELNNKVFSARNVTANTFKLYDSSNTSRWDTTALTAYTSGGELEQQEDTFSTLSHLEGETVDRVGDGAYLGTATVTSGVVTLSDFYNTVHIGLPYTSKVQPMQLELPSTPTMQGRTKRIHQITLRFFETSSAVVGASFDDFDTIVFRDADDPLEAVTPLFTGDKTLDFSGDYETQGNIFVQQLKPLPFTLLSLIPEFQTER